MKRVSKILLWVAVLSFSGAFADEVLDNLVEQVQAASLQQRAKVLNEAVGKETLWPAPGAQAWGDVMWALSLLSVNERVDEANARIRSLAETDEPFAYFGAVDYVRILALFNSRSPYFPGRLEPATEAVMKEVLWKWAKEFEEYWEPSRLEAAEPEGSVGSVYASENHDLIRKGNNHIIFSVLADDPAYSSLTCTNGHTVAEYNQLYITYFKKWLKERAASGLWMEVGAEYAKYSYSVLFNLFDLSPDPEIRTLAKMVLDISFIEEAQCSFHDGFRGGGKSRFPRSKTETVPGMVRHKQLLYGEGGSATHSRVFETSSYQVPEIAIFLREFGDSEPPFLMRNRVVGESVKPSKRYDRKHGETFYIANDSALVNYCYKTPAYMIGSTLQLLDAANDGYGDDSGITRQDRWGGVVFNDKPHSKVLPWADGTSGSTRVHNAYWQVQHENLMIAQRTMRARYVERMMVYFTPALERTETNGWVFASTGDAWVAVKAVGGHSWGKASHHYKGTTFLIPTNDYAPILFFAGSTQDGFASAEAFKNYVLNDIVLQENPNELLIQRPGKPDIQFFTDYRPPVINDADVGNPYNTALRTDYTYDSPYLKTGRNRYEVIAQWGDMRRVYDFESMTITETRDGQEMGAQAAMRNDQTGEDEAAYVAELGAGWDAAFRDDGTGDWQDRWFLDGEHATLTNTESGMEFAAGPTHLNHAHHAVLWTKQSFEGDVKIEYEYTKLDDTIWCVTLLYIQATGKCEGPYAKDISDWSELRREPLMPLYFEHMNLYHISYAAWDGFNKDPNDPGYIRARRYRAGPIEGTELQPDEYAAAGFFQTGVPHKITAIKSGSNLYFNVENLTTGESMLCHWENTNFPPVLEGRIGLRHMFTRSARYRDVKVSVRK